MLVDDVGTMATAAELEARFLAGGDVPPIPVDMMVPRDEVDEVDDMFAYVFGDDDGDAGETSPTYSSPGDDDGEAGCPSWSELEAAAAADEMAAAELEGSQATCSSPCDDVPGDGDGDGDVPGGELSDVELAARGLATGSSLPRDGRVRWWEIVAWCDSILPDWHDRFVARPDVRGLAIWHDRDVRHDGTPKKNHLHCMCGDAHGRKWSAKQAMSFASSVFGLRPDRDRRLVRPIKKPAGYALYLTHANCPDKVRYHRDEVMAFGGVDLDSVVGVVDNRHMILEDIYSWIDEFVEAYEVVPSFAAVVRYANSCRPAWSRVLASSAAKQVLAYVQSFSFDMDMDGRGAGTIRIVRAIIADEKKHGRAAKLSKGGDDDEE